MKYFLPAILLCIFLNPITNAQVLVAQSVSVFESYEPDNGFSPYISRLPQSFLPLIDDEYSKVLFNPAYLARIDNKQIYTTLEPGSTGNIRFTALFPQKWLFTFSIRDISGFTTETNNNDFHTLEIDSNSIGDKRIRDQTGMEESFEERTNSTRDIEFGLAKLINSSENRFGSLRLLVSYSTFNNSRNINDDQLGEVEEEIFRNDTLLVRRLDTNNRRTERYSKDDADKFYVSLEYASAGISSESKHRLFIQKGSYKYNNTRMTQNDRNDFDEDFEDAISRELIRMDVTRNVFTNNAGLLMLGYNGYLNRSVNLLGDDFIFITLNGNYSFGDADLLEHVMRNESREQDGETLSSSINSNQISIDDAKEWKALGSFGLGYAIRFRLDDLSFLSGFTPSFNYSKGNYYTPGGAIFKTEVEEFIFSGQVPLFADLNVSENVGIWGGGIISYSYTNVSRENEIEVLNTNPNIVDVSNVIINNQKDEELRSNQTTFFGVRATHKSGLKLLADINGDLTRFSGWRITIGYSF